MSKQFEGKTAIVTGGARGIGRSIVERLAADGAKVLIGDIDQKAGDEAVAAIGANVTAYALDVTSEDSWKGAVEAGIAFGGKIDILVNNAGIAGRSAPSWELSLAEWSQMIAIDLTGVFLGCKSVLPGMIELGYGRIVNIASIAGISARSAHSPHYSATKGAVVAFTRSVALEVAGANIFVNAMAPGGVATPAFNGYLEQIGETGRNRLWQSCPAGRFGTVEEYGDGAAPRQRRTLPGRTGHQPQRWVGDLTSLPTPGYRVGRIGSVSGVLRGRLLRGKSDGEAKGFRDRRRRRRNRAGRPDDGRQDHQTGQSLRPAGTDAASGSTRGLPKG